ncbi:Regulator of chromosome condensation RCC1 [Trinorchestia longiramus]|nr:Regulator of chromosome condensation RCC1 [Trinorchestia longiramus]
MSLPKVRGTPSLVASSVLHVAVGVVRGLPPLSFCEEAALPPVGRTALDQLSAFLAQTALPSSNADETGRRLSAELLLGVALQRGSLRYLLHWVHLALTPAPAVAATEGATTIHRAYLDEALTFIDSVSSLPRHRGSDKDPQVGVQSHVTTADEVAAAGSGGAEEPSVSPMTSGDPPTGIQALVTASRREHPLEEGGEGQRARTGGQSYSSYLIQRTVQHLAAASHHRAAAGGPARRPDDLLPEVIHCLGSGEVNAGRSDALSGGGEVNVSRSDALSEGGEVNVSRSDALSGGGEVNAGSSVSCATSTLHEGLAGGHVAPAEGGGAPAGVVGGRQEEQPATGGDELLPLHEAALILMLKICTLSLEYTAMCCEEAPWEVPLHPAGRDQRDAAATPNPSAGADTSTGWNSGDAASGATALSVTATAETSVSLSATTTTTTTVVSGATSSASTTATVDFSDIATSGLTSTVPVSAFTASASTTSGSTSTVSASTASASASTASAASASTASASTASASTASTCSAARFSASTSSVSSVPTVASATKSEFVIGSTLGPPGSCRDALPDPTLFLHSSSISSQSTSGMKNILSSTMESGSSFPRSCSDGEMVVYVWGSNSSHQLAEGPQEKVIQPKLTSAFGTIKQAEAGHYCTFLVGEDRSVQACGKGSYGRLGLGDSNNQTTPRQVVFPDSGAKVAQVSSSNGSDGHTLAMTVDGAVYTWGDGV